MGRAVLGRVVFGTSCPDSVSRDIRLIKMSDDKTGDVDIKKTEIGEQIAK